jgi:hypothetical protein
MIRTPFLMHNTIKEGILRQLGQCDQQQDEEYHQTQRQ